MKTYEETLQFLFTRLPMYQRQGNAAFRLDLSQTHELDTYFEHPHKKFPSIHIAGTNGKGSVAHILSAILQKSGYKTGLYTSPHLLDYRERIKINGSPVPKDFVTHFIDEHEAIIEKVKPSFFEMTFALAMDYFAQNNIDIAIIETGMGGRLDSTNIITPVLSVITNIGYDHTAFLGNTLPEIATEKAGIIKNAVPVIIGKTQPETVNVFTGKATEKDAPIYFADQGYSVEPVSSITPDKQAFNIREHNSLIYENISLSLPGAYQSDNMPAVCAAIEQLQYQGFSLAPSGIREGLARIKDTTGILGRWQCLQRNPRIIADIGHNESGIRYNMRQLQNMPHKNLYFIFGTVKDKNIHDVLPLLPAEAYYIFTQADMPRALPAEELKHNAGKYNLTGIYYSQVRAAIQKAQELASPEDVIFIGGSTFIVAEALEYFNIGEE